MMTMLLYIIGAAILPVVALQIVAQLWVSTLLWVHLLPRTFCLVLITIAVALRSGLEILLKTRLVVVGFYCHGELDLDLYNLHGCR